MDKNRFFSYLIDYPVWLKKNLPIFTYVKPFQFRRVMSPQGRALQTQYDLFDILRQPFSLLFGIIAFDVAVNLIYVFFRVFEKKNREYFCHFDAAHFFRRSLKALVMGLYLPPARLCLLWARILRRARLS